MGITRLNVRRKRCSTSTRWRSGSPRIFGRANKKNPNSAHATNPGTTRSKNCNQSIGAEDSKKRASQEAKNSPSSQSMGQKIDEDFVKGMSLLDVAQVRRIS